jgi:hypothetical protein
LALFHCHHRHEIHLLHQKIQLYHQRLLLPQLQMTVFAVLQLEVFVSVSKGKMGESK